MAKDIMYEPRGFWQVLSIDPFVGDAPPYSQYYSRNTNTFDVPLGDSNFRNGGRFPIVITKLSFAPINYTVARGTVDTDGRLVGPGPNAGAIMNRFGIDITAPQRKSFSKHTFDLGGLPLSPTATPAMRYSASPYASSLNGLCYWKFPKPYRLPKGGIAEFALGNVLPNGLDIDYTGEDPVSLINTQYQCAWHELGGRFGGSSRATPAPVRAQPTRPVDIGLATPEGTPFVYDNSGLFSGGFPDPQPLSGVSAQQFPNLAWSSKEFRMQDATSGNNSTAVSGMSVMLDQIDQDELEADRYGDTSDGASTDFQLTPMALRVPCRMRVTAGGTGEYWWRPGAPVGLMFNTVTPASVYELPEPITLGPGESLKLSVNFPNPRVDSNVSIIDSIRYNIGVALTGYAIVEG